MSQPIDNQQLLNMFRSGAILVIENQQTFNEINVFPVADNDTGSNLASLMQGILTVNSAKRFDKLIEQLAIASLTHARGNSGTIFTQFLYGLKPAQEKKWASLTEFCEAVSVAVSQAYQALEKPVEGTILSAMKAWSEACNKYVASCHNIKELIKKTLPQVSLAVKKTSEQMAILRDAHVVDAGAAAFLTFLEGMLAERQAISDNKAELPDTNTQVEHRLTAAPVHRYCTEAVIKNLTVGHDQLKSHIKQYGDSIVIAGDQAMSRVHIHTNDPAALLEGVSHLGELTKQKADDMLRQFEVQERCFKTALVIDSSADIPQTLIDEYQIHVLPVEVVVASKSYMDRLTIDDEQVYKALDSKISVATSSPNAALIERTLRQLQPFYDSFLFVTIAKSLSGTYDRIKVVAKNLGLDFVMVDSLRNSAAHGLLAYEAAKQVAAGKAIHEIASTLERKRLSSQIYVAVKDVHYMVLSGRLSKIKAGLIRFLNLKPIISLDDSGFGVLHDKAFGFKSAVKKLISLLEKQPGQFNYVITHANAEQDAKNLADKLTRIVGQAPLYIMPVSSAIGIHAGPGCLAIGVIDVDDI